MGLCEVSGNPLPLVLSILFTAGTTSIAAADSLTGNWTADTAHAPQRPVGLHIATLHIESDGNRLVIAENGATPEGTPYDLAFTATCDGSVNGIIENKLIDAAQCWRNDPRTVVFKLIREATPREWRTAEVAKNGQTMRITTTVVDSSGKEVKSVAVLLKE
jgi:hypothetical protein